MMTRRPVLLSIVTSLALLLAACGSTSGSGPTGTADAPGSLTISVVGSQLIPFAPLWAAAPEMAAIEQEYNTTITYPSFAKGQDAFTALQGGSADICNCGLIIAVKAAAARQPLDFVANMLVGPGTVAVGASRFEAERGRDLAAFDGATFGYTSEGSQSQASLAAAVEHAGLRWDDQNGVALGALAGFGPALESGRVDVAMMDVGTAAKSIRDGIGYPILNTNDYEAFRPIGGTVIGNGLVIPHEFRERHPELTQDLVNAVIAGLNRVRSETDAAAVYAMMPSTFQEAHPDQEAFAAEWALIQPAFLPTDGTVSAEAVRDTAKTVLTPAELSSPEVTGFVDNGLVDEAYRQLQIARPETGS